LIQPSEQTILEMVLIYLALAAVILAAFRLLRSICREALILVLDAAIALMLVAGSALGLRDPSARSNA
jgi:hypothetical protein